jgi:argininosuccinate lyase
MMPQKKNPDVAELARGTTGVAVGTLTGLLVTLKSLPLAYDRDLQTDKQQLRGLFAATVGAFTAMSALLEHAVFDSERLLAAGSAADLLATDAAEDLVRNGVPFRVAHEQIAAAVARGPLEARGDATASVRRRRSAGGPSPASVRAQVRRLRSRLRPR